jgi:hypothetical protein
MVLIYGLSSLLSSLDIRYLSICKLQIWLIYCSSMFIGICIALHRYTYTVIITLFQMSCELIAVNGAKRLNLVYLLPVVAKWGNKMDCYLGQE